MIARHNGDVSDLSYWRRRFPLSTRGLSLKDLMAISDQMGFHSRALKSDIPSLAQLALPAILHWDINHYVLLDRVQKGLRGDKYTILDLAKGAQKIDADELSKHFTGIVLEATPGTDFAPRREKARLKLSQLWSKIRGLAPSLTRILILSLIMQVVVLVVPLYTQIAIDTALPGSDVDLLNIIALGFGAILLLNATSLWVRSRLILSLSNSLSFQTAINLFRHTIFLPTAWYEKRHLGDVTSRFSSLQPISDLLSRGLVSLSSSRVFSWSSSRERRP